MYLEDIGFKLYAFLNREQVPEQKGQAKNKMRKDMFIISSHSASEVKIFIQNKSGDYVLVS